MYQTFQYRVRDASKKNILKNLSSKVNYMWNRCNAYSLESWETYGTWISKYDVQNFFSGLSKQVGLNSASIQLITHEHSKRRNQFKRCKLKWRTRKNKRSLGWIPFDIRSIKIQGNVARFMGMKFKFWKHRDHGKIKYGSFSENAKGQWFLNLVVEKKAEQASSTGKVIGIDLGLKNVATLDDNTEYQSIGATKKYAKKLAKAQRARNKTLEMFKLWNSSLA